jgi:signal recognition particle subunit SRP54
MPELLSKGSRKKRIANGAGISAQDINKILKQFSSAAKMAKRFTGKKGMGDLMNLMSQQKMMNIPK